MPFPGTAGGLEGYGITIGTAQLIAEMAKDHKRRPKNHPQQRRRWPVDLGGTNLIVGKVYDTTIAMRQQGNVEIWSGTPGAETDSGTKNLYWNACPQTLTKKCWVAIEGPYIIQVINPARIMDVLTSSDLAKSSTYITPSSITVHPADVLGYFDGWNPKDTAVIPTLKLYSSPVQTVTIKSGATVRAIWNDVNQRYEALDWTC